MSGNSVNSNDSIFRVLPHMDFEKMIKTFKAFEIVNNRYNKYNRYNNRIKKNK